MHHGLPKIWVQASEEEVLREALGDLAKEASEGPAEPMDTSSAPPTTSGSGEQLHSCQNQNDAFCIASEVYIEF